MAEARVIRRFWVILALSLGLISAASLGALIIGFEVDFTPYRDRLQKAASRALGREVRIKGPVTFKISLLPLVEAREIVVANPKGWGGELARAGLVGGQVRLWPLFQGRAQIEELSAHNVELSLEQRGKGLSNWKFDQGDEQGALSESEDGGLKFALLGLKNLVLQGVKATYRETGLKRPALLYLKELRGQARPGRGVRLVLSGLFQGEPWHFRFQASPSEGDDYRPRPWLLSLGGDVAGSPVKGSAKIAWAEAGRVRLRLGLGMERINVGAFLAWLGVARGVEARVESMALEIRTEGKSLQELLKKATFSSTLRGGHLLIKDPKTQAATRLEVEKGSFRVAGTGKPVVMEVRGNLAGEPAKIKVSGYRLIDFLRRKYTDPLKIEATVLGVGLTARSEAGSAVNLEGLKLDVTFKGPRLSTVNKALKLKLPPWGPYEVKGRLCTAPGGYRISGLEVRVGASDLSGDLALDFKGLRPRLDLKLAARVLQLNDFTMDSIRLALGGKLRPDAKKNGLGTLESNAVEEEIKGAHRLLSPKVLGALDLNLDFSVGRVLWGKDRLGQGKLKVDLAGGRLRLGPAEIEIPGGAVRVAFLYHPTPGQVETQISLKLKNFDYGILARRLDPETTMNGVISLDLDLKSKASKRKELMAKSQGELFFAVRPRNTQIGLFDIWAVNLLTMVFKSFDQEETSRLNCLVGCLVLREGLMRERLLLMDTTQIRAVGEATVDFKKRRIRLKLRPTAKRAQFFSLATPLEINGDFSDFKAGMAPGWIMGTVINVVTSPLTVPLRRLLGEAPPIDGKDVCLSAGCAQLEKLINR